MNNSIIAYNPCGKCEKDKCNICELNMYRQGIVKKDKWISVENMLPNKDELVLCIGAKGGMFLGEIKNFYSFDKSAYAYVPNSRGGRYAKYWMPLPTPPKMKGAE